MKRSTFLLFLVFGFQLASAQKIPSLYYHGNDRKKTKHSLVILSRNSTTTFVSFCNKELAQIWRKKSPQEINTTYRSKPNISSFSYNSKTGMVKLAAPSGLIKEMLKREFEFSDKELTAKGL
ncbi:hypothetical protein ACQ33O_08790 [Ferruginibacter sp. SUN002]|uniref:hypothetical protein n=1 Tax=Ferruginibacter sp. SUN002 TaxID=2937789 RepID=UPI003D36B0BC